MNNEPYPPDDTYQFVSAEIKELRAEIERLMAENSKLRDVLTWTEENCPGECKGPIRRALEPKP